MKTRILWVVLITALLYTGCGRKAAAEKEISISSQFGLAYAPLIILEKKHQELNLLKGIKISWVKLSNAAEIREAMLSGRVDIGFMGIPPFLIGADKEMGWKVFTGLSEAPLALISWKKNITSLADFTSKDRIALPQPGSIQHMLLSMGLEKNSLPPASLDNILVSLSHPDGLNALLMKKEISAQFTAPPYLGRALADKDIKIILSGEEAFGGPFTFIIGAASAAASEDRVLLKRIQSALASVNSWMNENPDESINILAEAFSADKKTIAEEFTQMKYTTEIRGLDSFAAFMTRAGYLKNVPANIYAE